MPQSSPTVVTPSTTRWNATARDVTNDAGGDDEGQSAPAGQAVATPTPPPSLTSTFQSAFTPSLSITSRAMRSASAAEGRFLGASITFGSTMVTPGVPPSFGGEGTGSPGAIAVAGVFFPPLGDVVVAPADAPAPLDPLGVLE